MLLISKLKSFKIKKLVKSDKIKMPVVLSQGTINVNDYIDISIAMIADAYAEI